MKNTFSDSGTSTRSVCEFFSLITPRIFARVIDGAGKGVPGPLIVLWAVFLL